MKMKIRGRETVLSGAPNVSDLRSSEAVTTIGGGRDTFGGGRGRSPVIPNPKECHS